MKIIILCGLLLLNMTSHSRQMYKVKCYTPAAKEDRTKLSRYIHLDMINEDYVVAVVNQDELKNLQTKVNLQIEIVSAFDTDTVQLNHENFNMQLLMQDQVEQGLNFNQEYYVSSKSQLKINLNDIIKEKIPGEKREYNFSMMNSPILAPKWEFLPSSNIWKSFGHPSLKGKQEQIMFETSSAIIPMIKITLIINYL